MQPAPGSRLKELIGSMMHVFGRTKYSMGDVDLNCKEKEEISNQTLSISFTKRRAKNLEPI